MTGTSIIRERLQELASSCINDDVQRMTSLADGAWWSRRDIFHAIEPNNPGSTWISDLRDGKNLWQYCRAEQGCYVGG